MKTVIVHVQEDFTAQVTCPFCQRRKSFSVAPFRQRKHTLKIRCRCEAVFLLQLDYRRFYRKPVSLTGTYRTLSQYQQRKGAVHITDISLAGIRCTVAGLNKLDTGYVLDLDFMLDNRVHSSITKRAVVRSCQGNQIGCEFVEEKKDRNLIGYLL